MRLRRKKSEENGITEVVVTETDQVVLNMSSAAERLRSLDTEMLSTFIEWRVAQSRCRDNGLLVEIEMAEPLRAAYQTWLAEQYRPASADDAETGVIHRSEIPAGDPGSGHVHGWPMRMAAQVTAW
jgi:hypothetical protein